MDDLDVLWPAIARADADAFARFLAHAEPPLRASLLRFARSVDLEVIVQETMLRIWQVAPRYQPDGRPNGLLRLSVRIARNLALDECKRSRRHPTESLEEDDADAVAPQALPDPWFRDAVQSCLEALDGKPRQVLQTRLDDHGAHDDRALATRCQMTHNTFLQNLSRARKALAECLHRRTGWEATP